MATDLHRLEALTQDYGREIFARLSHTNPLLLSPAWWDERLMEWTMSQEAIKVQLFRFIDVLPLLHTAPEITRHLPEILVSAQAAVLLESAELAEAYYAPLAEAAPIGRFFWGPAGIFPFGPTSRILG